MTKAKNQLGFSVNLAVCFEDAVAVSNSSEANRTLLISAWDEAKAAETEFTRLNLVLYTCLGKLIHKPVFEMPWSAIRINPMLSFLFQACINAPPIMSDCLGIML